MAISKRKRGKVEMGNRFENNGRTEPKGSRTELVRESGTEDSSWEVLYVGSRGRLTLPMENLLQKSRRLVTAAGMEWEMIGQMVEVRFLKNPATLRYDPGNMTHRDPNLAMASILTDDSPAEVLVQT